MYVCIYTYIELLDRHSGILQAFCYIGYHSLYFSNYGKANLKKHLSVAASEDCNCLFFCQLLIM